MKKIVALIISSIFLAILMFVVFTSAGEKKLTENEALKIGEEKYLEFLWMVDGAFNNERLDGEFTVNGKKLSDDNKKFTCTYKNKNDNTCIGNHFEEAFSNLFASNITYYIVYSDANYNTWFKYDKGKYTFINLVNCNAVRMSLNQELKINKITSDELDFIVIMQEERNQGVKNKEFVLIKENDEWKISKAYYHDLCEMDYRIK